ncbi:Homeobox protein knotted-1-like LET6 [Phytophthora ramorum]|uniref:Homeobox domain-containing protein n=1 Tax=Phytophthora ramorum TaxID=164328 RepID=H3H1E7_PHYRM|nr:Homeobox protein knotted-1-like LET6 [Phytophthora ramorum]
MTFPNRANYRLRSREKSQQAALTANDVPVEAFEAFRHVTHEDVMAAALQCCDAEEEEKAAAPMHDHALLPLAHKLLAMIAQPAKLLAALVVHCTDRTSKQEFWVKAVAYQHAELRTVSDCWCILIAELDDQSEMCPTDVAMLKAALYLWRLWQFVCLMCVDAVASVEETSTLKQEQKWTTTLLQKRHAPALNDQSADALTQGMILSGSGPAKRSRITKKSNEFLVAWFLAHKDNPYPSPDERTEIADKTGLAEQQVRNWFANMRKRHWKPNRSNAKKPRCLLDYVLRQTEA